MDDVLLIDDLFLVKQDVPTYLFLFTIIGVLSYSCFKLMKDGHQW